MTPILRLCIGSIVVTALVGCASGVEVNVSTTSPSTTGAPGDTTTSVPGPVRISVTVGEDSGSGRIETVALGSSVEVTLVNPGAADNFHLHGYDIESGNVAAGTPTVISFSATEAGLFEIESHVTEVVYVVIDVQ